jgi:hypothetical protein
MSLATNKSASSPLGRDAEDPDHTLMTPAWNQGQFGTMFNTTVHPIRDNLGQGNNPESYFTVPTVISFGKDGKPGVDRWLGVVDAALASDNLYSFRLR